MARPSLFKGRGLFGWFLWILSVLFAAAAIEMAREGAGSWIAALLVTGMSVVYTLIPWLDAARDGHEERMNGTLTIDDWGVTRIAPNLREAIAWKKLAWVRIQTTGAGPGAEDFVFALGGADGKGCVVPNALAVRAGLVAHLNAHLPDIDDLAFAEALGSVHDATFTVWTRRDEAPEV